MTHHRPRPRRRLRRPGGRSLAAGALAAVLALATAGCSQAGRAHPLPDDLCGVEVDSRLLSPFLPDGRELTQRSHDAGATSPRCRVSVDDELVMYLSGDVVPADTDPFQVQDRGLRRLGRPTPTDVGDAARVADRGALAVADCTRAGEPVRFTALIQLEKEIPEETSQRRSDLTRLLRAYFPKARAALDCGKT